ncbi:MAG: tetratricopeptide repeat protein [Verrucomicrobia bacterium]|nr:tetratricopeptide repeat protein [Verrucomicrobiota bacterium]
MPEGTEHRKLAAIMFTDMVGYSALAQRNEALALELLEEHRRLLRPVFPKHNGREVETAGDAFLVEFASALEAVRCAMEIQEQLSERNRTAPPERAIRLRIGIHVGDVVHKDGKVMGDAVNIAARIEPLAEAGGICLSRPVFDQVANKLEVALVKLGSPELKNIKVPMEVYRMVLPWQPGSELSRSSLPAMTKRPQRRRAVLGLAAILFVIGVYVVFWPRTGLRKDLSVSPIAPTNSVTQPALDRLRIALLPFENLSPDPDNDYFARTIADQLGTKLSEISGLRIIPVPGTNFTMLEPLAIGQKAKSGTLLTGSASKTGGRINVNVRLVDAVGGDVLWGELFSGEFQDWETILNRLVSEVARVLDVILLEPERRQIERRYTDNFKAFELYVKGRDAWNTFTREGLRQGIVYFKQAIEEDRNYTLAYSGLADCYTILLAALHEPPQDVLPDAKRYAEIVEKRAPDLAQAQVSLGMYYLFAGLNWEKARDHLTRAVTLKPRYADAHHFLAHYFESQGKFEDAKKEWDRAQELDLLSNMIAAELGQTYLFAGDYPRAVALCREAVAKDSEFLFGLQVLGAALTFTGDYTNAIQTLQRAQALKEGDWPLFIAELAHTYAKAGDIPAAKDQLDKLLNLQRGGRFVDPCLMAWVYAGLNDKPEALRWLDRAVREGSGVLFWVKVDPRLKPLHSEPGFPELLKRMKLEP